MPVTANKDMVLYQKVCDILISYVGFEINLKKTLLSAECSINKQNYCVCVKEKACKVRKTCDYILNKFCSLCKVFLSPSSRIYFSADLAAYFLCIKNAK
jgi:hypothetical protein